MHGGLWLLVGGCWLVVGGCWLLATGLLVTASQQPVVRTSNQSHFCWKVRRLPASHPAGSRRDVGEAFRLKQTGANRGACSALTIQDERRVARYVAHRRHQITEIAMFGARHVPGSPFGG